MKAAIVEGERKLVVKEVPKPVLDPDEVLIKVQCCGICGSDLEVYTTGANIRVGHEYSGDIVEVGSEVKGWKVGDRVVVQPRRPCGTCYWCKRGYEIGLCEQFYTELLRYGGAFATYAKAKHDQLYRIPNELSYEYAAVAQPMATPLYAIKISGMQIGDTVAVLGLGPIGQLLARLAKMAGARAVYATEISRPRIKLARNMVDEAIDINVTDPVDRILELTDGMGVDVVFECSGSAPAIQQSLALVKNGGTIVIVGICMDWVELPISKMAFGGLTLKGLIAYTESEFGTAVNLIKEHRIDVASLITSKMPLENIDEAFEKALRGEEGKILIIP
jgi:2-desacetyl-2-hydroxyethyl bacteriochlorophyllide A dehydrogenase